MAVGMLRRRGGGWILLDRENRRGEIMADRGRRR